MMSLRKDMITGLLDMARCYLRLVVGPEWGYILLRECGRGFNLNNRGSGMAEILTNC